MKKIIKKLLKCYALLLIICIVFQTSFATKVATEIVAKEINPEKTIEHTETPKIESSVRSVTLEKTIEHTETLKIESSKRLTQPQPINWEFDISKTNEYTTEQLEEMFRGPYYDKIRPYINTFIAAEQMYGINAFFLMCLTGLESGWFKYTSGENNIAGWMCNDGSFMDFGSIEECIMHVAAGIMNNYIPRIGSNIGKVTHHYCYNEGYTQALLNIMCERVSSI